MAGVLCALVAAQAGRGEEMIQPQRIVNCHTAGLLPRSSYEFEASVYPNGSLDQPGSGLLLGVTVGLLNRLNIGVSYGGDGIIGRQQPVFNPHIGALIKYRLFEETYFFPAFAVGYDHQGSGGIDQEYNGYVYKSPGFFVVASKNYLLFTKLQLGVHGGMNYSLEENRIVKWPNAYVGAEAIHPARSISADGTILAATSAELAGAVAFHLPAPDTAAMLGLLRGAQGHLTPSAPGTSAGHEPGAARPAGPPPRQDHKRPRGPSPQPHHPQPRTRPRQATAQHKPGSHQ